MPTVPYALTQTSISAGAPATGFRTPVAGAATVQISGVNTASWTSVSYELFQYPPGWPTPSGWTLLPNGLIVSVDTTPVLITLEAASVRWGKWLGRTRVNNGVKNARVDSEMLDETWGWEVKSPVLGATEIGAGETTQVDAFRGWTAGNGTGLRAIEAAFARLATPPSALALANGANNDLVVSSAFARITGPSGAFSVTGFVAPTADGTRLDLFNTTAQAMTIANEGGTSTAANRIKTLTGADVVLAARTTAAQFIYDLTSARWILLGTS